MTLQMSQPNDADAIATAINMLADGTGYTDKYAEEMLVFLQKHGYSSVTSADALSTLVASPALYEMVSRFNAILTIVGVTKRKKVRIAQAMLAGQYAYTNRVKLKAYTIIPRNVLYIKESIELAAALGIYVLNIDAIHTVMSNRKKTEETADDS